MLTDEDMGKLQFSTGQSMLLKRWVHSLQTPTEQTGQEAEPETEDDALSDLLAEATAPTTGNPLFPCEFAGGPLSFDQDTTVCTQGSSRLVLKARDHIAPGKLSLSQWVSANARIMRQLINDGTLGTKGDILSYLDYVETVGNYAQVNTIFSVMIYDQEFRRKQAEKRRSWDCEDFYLAKYLLVKKDQTPDMRPRYNHQQSTVEICRNFNSPMGCYREHCRYTHVCLVCHRPGHTSSTHRSTQPLDPTTAAYVPSSSAPTHHR